ncbi:MAG: serine hydrolase, partial [Pseudomonadota bacterium]
GYGCSLASGGRVAPLPERTIDAPSAETNAAIKTNDEIRAIVDAAIINNPSNHRAIVVMHDGEIISEGYAEGFSDKTPLLGWSMSKSVIGTLVGAAVEAGFLSLDDPIGAPEWPGGDDRSALTWRHLLQMQSGLAFDEDYRNLRSDAVRMLFEQADAGAYAVRQPAAAPPNAMFNYSSGTTNILARALNDLLKENDTDIYAFATNRIFRPIGASSFVMEPDAAGNPVGSSFIYATARDWARLGQLYLQDGVWADKPILPSGWTTFTQDPASESDGQYGGQVWLNRDGAFERERDFPSLPESAYYFSGHEGQFVLIMPSNNMVIARLGMTRRGSAEPAVDALAADIISTLY